VLISLWKSLVIILKSLFYGAKYVNRINNFGLWLNYVVYLLNPVNPAAILAAILVPPYLVGPSLNAAWSLSSNSNYESYI